jgi:hypothetical protein
MGVFGKWTGDNIYLLFFVLLACRYTGGGADQEILEWNC